MTSIELYGKTIAYPEGELALYTPHFIPAWFFNTPEHCYLTPEGLRKSASGMNQSEFVSLLRRLKENATKQAESGKVELTEGRIPVTVEIPNFDTGKAALERTVEFSTDAINVLAA